MLQNTTIITGNINRNRNHQSVPFSCTIRSQRISGYTGWLRN